MEVAEDQEIRVTAKCKAIDDCIPVWVIVGGARVFV
jgi:hypothetical protein